MTHVGEIELVQQDPKLLEELYQKAKRAGWSQEFAADIAQRHEADPANPLLAAWYYRLSGASAAAGEEHTGAAARQINWRLAATLSLVLALVFAVLANERFDLASGVPFLILAWAPLAGCFLVAFLTLAGRWPRQRLWIILGVVAVTAYVAWMVVGRPVNTYMRDLMALHLPLMAWAAVGLCILGRGSANRGWFGFLIKSVEVILTGGIFFGAAFLFIAITSGLFDALGIQLGVVMRTLMAGAAGLIPVLAAATVYDPQVTPAGQRLDQGLPKLASTVGRVFLPLTLIVAVIYVASIPANFMKPFEQRDVLIIYNAMLFAVMGLIVMATPAGDDEPAGTLQIWLRRGLIALAVLTVLVSVYALSATVYRTALGGLTMNRLTIIGWNTINIALLCHYLYRQVRGGLERWVASSHAAFRVGMAAYAAWTLFLLLAVPLLFG